MKPILCHYYITYRCNARCQFCDIWQNSEYRQIHDSSLDEIGINLSQLKKLGVMFIDFTGGEPLLHRDLPEMLTLAKSLNFYTSVTTNCSLYPKMAAELKGKIDLLHFSIDSLDQHEHDALRGCANHHHVMESIEYAKQLGERPDLLFTATPWNYRALKSLSKFAANHKLMLIVNPLFCYSDQPTLSNTALDYLEQFKSVPYVYINRAFQELLRHGGNKRKNPRCRAMSSTIVISPDNRLLLPCFHQVTVRMPIQSKLARMLQSPLYQKMKKRQGQFVFCQNCTINCYFDPSFLYKLDRYFLLSLLSKAKYGFDKYLRHYVTG